MEFERMTIAQIAKAHWTDNQAAKDIGQLVTDWLFDQDPNTEFGTTAILRALGADYESLTRLSSHLTNARQRGYCEGFWHPGKIGAFKRPKIVWHNRRKAHPPLPGSTNLSE